MNLFWFPFFCFFSGVGTGELWFTSRAAEHVGRVLLQEHLRSEYFQSQTFTPSSVFESHRHFYRKGVLTRTSRRRSHHPSLETSSPSHHYQAAMLTCGSLRKVFVTSLRCFCWTGIDLPLTPAEIAPAARERASIWRLFPWQAAFLWCSVRDEAGRSSWSESLQLHVG